MTTTWLNILTTATLLSALVPYGGPAFVAARGTQADRTWLKREITDSFPGSGSP